MIYLFYAGMLVRVFKGTQSYRNDWAKYAFVDDPEIYNGGYVYDSGKPVDDQWWRCDLTPVLLVHVPKEFRVLVLLTI